MEPIKRGLSKYIKRYYYEDVITVDPSFGDTPFEFKADQMTEVLGPLLTVVEIIIIIVVVICALLIACGVVIYDILIKKKNLTPTSTQYCSKSDTCKWKYSIKEEKKPINVLG